MKDIVFSAVSPLGHQITCTEEGKNHICLHEIMINNLIAVENTIKSPNVIYKSSDKSNRQVFFSRTTATYAPLYTKVIVEVNDITKTGEVVSAFPQKDIAGGIDIEAGLLHVKL